jgi:HEAT repeat protein
MPRELLEALAADVDRLLVAGARVAAGHEGLRKRALELRKVGAKVPVFAQIAQAVQRVVEAPLSGVPTALLNLLLLCRQARAGLASAGVEGALEPIPRSGPWETPAPSPELADLVDALSRNGSGRQAVLNEAVKHGVEPDLRLLGPSLQALQDRDGGLADTVAQSVLPSFGGGILDDLRNGLDLGGNAPDARRLLAIRKIAPDLGKDLCRAALQQGSATVRLRALELLAELAPLEAADFAVSILESRPKPWKLRRLAVWVLSRKSRRDKRTIAVLLDALGDGWQGDPGTAAETLGKIGKSIVPALIERLEHPKADVRLYAAWALKAVGPAAAPAVPHLIECMKDTAFLISRWAIWALQAIGPEASPLIVPALQEALTDRRLEVRVLAAAALANFGRVNADILATLTAALKAYDWDIMRFATEALSELGQKAVPAVPFLIKALASNSFPVRRCAAQALGGIGAADAVKPLIRALEDKHWLIRNEAINALAQIGPRAKAAVPALTALSNHEDSQVHEQVRTALDSIQRKT